jgi:hypothetical protein
VNEFNFIYLKQLDNINELFSKHTKLPSFIRKTVLFFKQIFGTITVNKNGICIIPYKDFKKWYKLKMYYINRFLKKKNCSIILSKYLESLDDFKNNIKNEKIDLIEGKRLSNYIIPEILEYICKMINEEIEKQDITILVQEKNADIEKAITYIAKKVKRIQIVTPQIHKFKTLENDLEFKYGLACQITNNKRKSLLKSKIIVNLDYLESTLNQFTINQQAILIDINNNTTIHSKLFMGIHIYNYNITANIKNDIFDVKNIMEAMALDKTYEQIRTFVQNEKVQVTGVIGKNGVINKMEFNRIKKEKFY